jgi:hypothetical protein
LFAADFLTSIDDGRIDVEVDYRTDTVQAMEVAEFIMAKAGLEVHPRTPAIGRWINKVFSGVHSGAVVKAKAARLYAPYNNTAFGHEVPMIIGAGKYQGTRGLANQGPVIYESGLVVIIEEVAEKLAMLGLDLDAKATEQVVMAMNTQALKTEKPLADSEIEAFAAQLIGQELHNEISSYSFAGETRDGASSARITLETSAATEPVVGSSEIGKGQVDAAVHAFNSATGFTGDITNIELFNLSTGSDSSAGAIVTVSEHGQPYTAHGEGISLDDASVAAYITVYNMIQRIKARTV